MVTGRVGAWEWGFFLQSLRKPFLRSDFKALQMIYFLKRRYGT